LWKYYLLAYISCDGTMWVNYVQQVCKNCKCMWKCMQQQMFAKEHVKCVYIWRNLSLFYYAFKKLLHSAVLIFEHFSQALCTQLFNIALEPERLPHIFIPWMKHRVLNVLWAGLLPIIITCWISNRATDIGEIKPCTVWGFQTGDSTSTQGPWRK
jgi:hypothetical protein